jgi:hypothetical protein
MKPLLAATIAILLAGCAIGPTGLPEGGLSNAFRGRPDAPPIAYGEQLVGLGEPAHFIDVSLTPIMVAEDSRCPRDAQCVQAGTARVSTAVVENGVSRIMVLAIGAPVAMAGRTVALTALCPPPAVLHRVIQPREIRVGYAVVAPGGALPPPGAC